MTEHPLPPTAEASDSLSHRSLHRKTPSLSSYQTTPISKHYDVNHQILAAFESHYERKVYSIAYAIGLQFVETALLEIPKHGYFYSQRHERERMQSSLDAVRVTQLLHELQTDLPTSEIDQIRVSKLHDLAVAQVEQASEDQYERQRAQAEEELLRDWSVCEPMLVAYDSLTNVLCPAGPTHSNSVRPPRPPRLLMEPKATAPRPVPRYAVPALPPPPPPSSSPPMERSPLVSPPPLLRARQDSFDLMQQQPQQVPWDRVVSSDEIMLEKALYLSGLEVTPTVSVDADDNDVERRIPPSPGPRTNYLELSTVSRFYHEDFDAMRRSGKIRVSFASTYQGRLSESTNGCTVIAPLLCIHHLLDDQMPDPGLPDAVIEEVIDSETPAILAQLRNQLGLSAQAFLIPSDAHDYLIANGQLSQDQFINVTGGNILDENHVDAFIKSLEQSQRRKVAATFFFHEHVVAILKVRRNSGAVWYDLIDGLPLKDFMTWVDESDHDFAVRLNLTDSQRCLSEAFLPKTARIRCLNAEALTACLRWYACSKLSTDNVSYIDQYAWDDKSCDFDPRVFQGFVWGSSD